MLPAAVLLWQLYEFDPVWYIVWTLEKLGLAWDVKLPTERDLSRRRVQPQQPAAISN
jgi:fatty-acid desaturase